MICYWLFGKEGGWLPVYKYVERKAWYVWFCYKNSKEPQGNYFTGFFLGYIEVLRWPTDGL